MSDYSLYKPGRRARIRLYKISSSLSLYITIYIVYTVSKHNCIGPRSPRNSVSMTDLRLTRAEMAVIVGVHSLSWVLRTRFFTTFNRSIEPGMPEVDSDLGPCFGSNRGKLL